MKQIELLPTDFSRVVFCDGSAFPAEDGHEGTLIKSAAWSAFDCSFVIKANHAEGLAKEQMIMLSEKIALDLALTLEPDSIYSDAKNLITRIGGMYNGVPVSWIRRKYNGIADALSKYPEGKGYVAFNSPQVGRDWIDFVYTEYF